MKFQLLISLVTVFALCISALGQNADVFKRKAIEAKMLSVAKWQSIV